MIRVHLLEAEKLAQKDSFLGIRGKSDPYAKVSIGLQHFRSRTIYKNLNPTWNEVFEVRVSWLLLMPSRLCWVMLGPNKGGPLLHMGQHWGREVGLFPTSRAAGILLEGQLVSEFPTSLPHQSA